MTKTSEALVWFISFSQPFLLGKFDLPEFFSVGKWLFASISSELDCCLASSLILIVTAMSMKKKI